MNKGSYFMAEDPDQIKSKEYRHRIIKNRHYRDIDRVAAEKELMDNNEIFIFRQSSTHNALFVCTYKLGDKYINILFGVNRSGYRRYTDRGRPDGVPYSTLERFLFNNLPEKLYQRYVENEVEEEIMKNNKFEITEGISESKENDKKNEAKTSSSERGNSSSSKFSP